MSVGEDGIRTSTSAGVLNDPLRTPLKEAEGVRLESHPSGPSSDPGPSPSAGCRDQGPSRSDPGPSPSPSHRDLRHRLFAALGSEWVRAVPRIHRSEGPNGPTRSDSVRASRKREQVRRVRAPEPAAPSGPSDPEHTRPQCPTAISSIMDGQPTRLRLPSGCDPAAYMGGIDAPARRARGSTPCGTSRTRRRGHPLHGSGGCSKGTSLGLVIVEVSLQMRSAQISERPSFPVRWGRGLTFGCRGMHFDGFQRTCRT
eukprot:gene12402-biopygen9449